jgi:hypothetical protein
MPSSYTDESSSQIVAIYFLVVNPVKNKNKNKNAAGTALGLSQPQLQAQYAIDALAFDRHTSQAH